MISSELQSAIDRAFGYAASEGRGNVEVEHLLLSLLELPSIVKWLKNDPAEIETLRVKLHAHLARFPKVAESAEGSLSPSPPFAGIMQRAILEAQKSHRLEVQPSDVAHLILSNKAFIARWANAS